MTIYSIKYIVLLVIPILLAIFYSNVVENIKNAIITTSKLYKQENTQILFTKSDLNKFNGEIDINPIYLSVLGSIYDVTKGKKHYGKGCSYNFFAGKDASVAFITGDFETYTDKSDDILQLKPSEILSLYNWKKFYDKEYIYIGKLIGRFYDKNGSKTKYFQRADELVKKAQERKLEDDKMKNKFPPCNIEWSKAHGTKVWCSSHSGGVKREWSGVPRKYYEPGQKDFRCACVDKNYLNSPGLKPYENCDLLSDTCFYTIKD